MTIDTKGICPHGEFELEKGCQLCIAEARQAFDPAIIPIPEKEEHPGTDMEVMEWSREAVRLYEYASSRTIASIDDLKAANNDLSIIARLKKAMEERRQFYVRPLNDQVKAINDNYRLLMRPVEEAEKITKQKMLDFNYEQERRRREQEEVNRMRIEAAQKEAALNDGEISQPVNIIEVSPGAPRKVMTDLGTSGMRDNWKFRVVDKALVPEEYKVIDTAMLNAIAKKHHDGKQIQGIVFYNEPIIATRAR